MVQVVLFKYYICLPEYAAIQFFTLIIILFPTDELELVYKLLIISTRMFSLIDFALLDDSDDSAL